MTLLNLIDKLPTLKDADLSNGTELEEVPVVLQFNQVCLPKDHVELLKKYNGVQTYGGYFRLFGFDNGSGNEINKWNSENEWRFAWGGLLDDYLCFGETAWGDQYAYHVNELLSGTEKVYFIEGLTMEAEPIAESFSDFLQSEFIPNSVSPYDELTVEVRKRLGRLNPNEHIIFVPSPLLGGDESSENVQKIETITGMIFNGDLCCQLAHESTERDISRIEQIVDDSGRQRLIVKWA